MDTISKWSQPIVMSDLDVGFGPRDMSTVLPAWEEIPEDFKREWGEAKKWTDAVDDIFFCGVQLKVVVMKPGVDKKTAMRQLQCILHSFEPSHEHKTSGVAYLMSLWFERFDYVKVSK